MPSYKTKQVDEQDKPIYQDVCYPVTKDFREILYNEIISEYEKAKDKSNEKARESAEKHHGNPDKEKDKEATCKSSIYTDHFYIWRSWLYTFHVWAFFVLPFLYGHTGDYDHVAQ